MTSGIEPSLSHVTAVVLNWRTPEDAVASARALVGDGLAEERIVIVDNGSGPCDVERLRRALRRARVVALPQNVGFSVGNNAGAAALPGEVYLFVNSDAFVRLRGSVMALVAVLAEPSHVGIAVPRLVRRDGSTQPSVVPLTTPAVALLRASGLSRLVPNQHQPRWSTHWDHRASRPVEAACGAVLAVRAGCWDDLGGFDERHHMYAEELDLFFRARSRGWTTRFVAEAEFVHVGNASGRRRWTSPERAERVGLAEAAVVRRHLSARRAAVALAAMAAGHAVRWGLFAAMGHERAAVERGSLRGLRGRAVR